LASSKSHTIENDEIKLRIIITRILESKINKSNHVALEVIIIMTENIIKNENKDNKLE
jgi:hypothetical protein